MSVENDLYWEIVYIRTPRGYKFHDKIKLFDKKFVENNKDKCKIIYNDKEYQLTEFFDEKEKIEYFDEEFKIKIKGINNILDMSYMFNECIHLWKILDNPKEKNTQVIFEAKDDFLGYNDQSLRLDDTQINIDEEKNSIYKGNNTLSSSISSITKDNISVFTYSDYCRIKEHYPLIKNVIDMNHMF